MVFDNKIFSKAHALWYRFVCVIFVDQSLVSSIVFYVQLFVFLPVVFFFAMILAVYFDL